MKTWQVRRAGEPREVLVLAEAPTPEPPPGFVRVRVSACALGLPDLLMCRGSYPLTPEVPFTPGQELAGIVTQAGEGAEASVGDAVMGVSAFFLRHGGFAEEALALDDFVFSIPDFLSHTEAAAFVIPYHTAWVGLVRRARLRAGETLLVLGGAGGTGSAAIQLGCALGARVIATARAGAKADFCRELGAESVIDHRSEPIAESVRAITAGRGADVVYDTVGGDAFQAATHCIAHEGRILAIGFASGSWGRPDLGHAAMRNYSILGVVPSGYDRAVRSAAQAELLEHMKRGSLRVPVGAVYPFSELPEALEALAQGQIRGKAVLRGFDR